MPKNNCLDSNEVHNWSTDFVDVQFQTDECLFVQYFSWKKTYCSRNGTFSTKIWSTNMCMCKFFLKFFTKVFSIKANSVDRIDISLTVDYSTYSWIISILIKCYRKLCLVIEEQNNNLSLLFFRCQSFELVDYFFHSTSIIYWFIFHLFQLIDLVLGVAVIGLAYAQSCKNQKDEPITGVSIIKKNIVFFICNF